MATPKPKPVAKPSLQNEVSAEYQKQLASSRKYYGNVDANQKPSVAKTWHTDMAEKGTRKALSKKYPNGSLDLGGTIKGAKDRYLAPGETTDTNRKSAQRRAEQGKKTAAKAAAVAAAKAKLKSK